MSEEVSYDDLLSSLADLGRAGRRDDEMAAKIDGIVAELRSFGELTRDSLSLFIASHPDSVPLLATCVGLTQEQLKNQLSHRFQSAAWTTLARRNAGGLLEYVDGELDLVNLLRDQLVRPWSLSDVLLERHLWSRRGAAHAVGQGRRVEDVVEAVVHKLGVPAHARTRFLGRGGQTAPCDMAIPGGQGGTMIVVAMKGYNSTGSKLTDAVREIEEMANVRLPWQYVYAVIDGIGWRNRQGDLHRIYELYQSDKFDGLYTLAHMDRLEDDLRKAAERLGLVAT